ncbi:hypothetical protein DLREEDagrD3_06070 [Denitratisoma sp. agr-D3]
MFDIGFSELMVIAVVALVVIGPERLPAVARTVGGLLGRAQRYFNSVKAEVNRELQLEELKRIQQETYDRVMAMETEVKTELARLETDVHSAATALDDPAPAPVATVAAADTADLALPAAAATQSVGESMVVPTVTSAAPSEAPAVAAGQADLFAESHPPASAESPASKA